MSVNILLITHEAIGAELIKATKNTYGKLPLRAEVITVDYKTSPEHVMLELTRLISSLETDHGLLVLTDLYGSTPCNIALALEQYHNVEVVTGLNLPMLLKVMNYPQLDLVHLAEKAVIGGKEGVINAKPKLCG